MLLPALPRWSQKNWDPGQMYDLRNIWDDINRAINTNAQQNSVIRITHADRLANFPAANYPVGTLLEETDRKYLYLNEDVAGVPTWVLIAGLYVAALASRPSDLGASDVGAKFFATDTNGKTWYIWSGVAWLVVDFIPGDLRLSGDLVWLSGTAFTGTLTHNNSANRSYAFPDDNGTMVYTGVALTTSALILGAGTSKVSPLASLGTTTTVLHGNAAGAPSFAQVDLAADVSGILPFANGGTGVVATVQLTAQNADIAPTNFAGSATGTQFTVRYNLLDTAIDLTAGTLVVTIAWTDDIGATTFVSAAVDLTGVSRRSSGIVVIERASGTIAYSTTVTGIYGTATYALYMTLERTS